MIKTNGSEPIKSSGKCIIDLRGPEGNAICLLGYALNAHTEIESSGGKIDKGIDEILIEMKSGDFNNLIEVFEKYFGNHFDVYV